jgi:DNA-binding IclR family transcriptional regulator
MNLAHYRGTRLILVKMRYYAKSSHPGWLTTRRRCRKRLSEARVTSMFTDFSQHLLLLRGVALPRLRRRGWLLAGLW